MPGKGRPFQKGQSGNPAGKPKAEAAKARNVADVRAAAKEYTAEAIETLASVMRSPKSPPAARVAAASTILDRGHGKAPQTIDANIRRIDQYTETELVEYLARLDAVIAAGDGGEADGDGADRPPPGAATH